MQTMHLFAGAGGGLLADLILGHKPIISVEWEPYACQVLRERAADGWFPGLSVWEGDVRMFDPSDYAGRVDCIHAGFPCQDLSVAGQGNGLGEGTRSGLYREVLRIAGVVRPRYIFLENVSAILNRGLGTVLGDLAAMGYDAKWVCLRASEVGAPHHRDRWWCLCTRRSDVFPHAEYNGNGRREQFKEGIEEKESRDITYTKRIGQPRQGESLHTSHQKKDREGKTGDVKYVGIGRKRPVESDMGGMVDGLAVGMDAHWWGIEPEIGRVTNEHKNRKQRLTTLGNGQVPLQAAVAWKLLGGP